ncbi:MarR family transcriptional regulator [Planctomonas sp. JC2975]|uniref:MarR family winged helix-turn-helix transcriptional regulator n=1 Tax=Planctomonas sp. JC2975 TaxID=2729626 RepID=UPI001474B424|nr:MarR family transcriptional regulator [Planctomonas sp. JC2975]NNC11573.1 MarR family transcriptional regulator [Planctomonas sp. JC2975]
MSNVRPSSGDATDALGYLLKHALRSLIAQADAALEPLGIDRKEFGVLTVLAAHEPLSQQALGSLIGIDPTTMVAVIDALEAKRIVTRTPDPADRRRNAIALTESGRGTFRDAGSAYAEAEREFLAPLSDAESERFRRTLRALNRPEPSAAGPS